MNPVHWIRWKVLVALVVSMGGLAIFGMGPLAKKGINRLGAAGYGARWNVNDLQFSPFAGRLTIGGLDITSAVPSDTSVDPVSPSVGALAKNDGGPILSAQSLVFHLDMAELMRRRYYGDLHLQGAKLTIERRADGTMNVALGAPTASSEVEQTDWWAEAQKLMRKLQQWDEERRELADKIPRGKTEQKVQAIASQKRTRFRVDYSRRVTYPFLHKPQFVASKLVGEGIEIVFLDHTPGADARGATPPIQNGRILIENASDRPTEYAEPVRWTITGDIAGAPIMLVGTLDVRQAGDRSPTKRSLQFDFQADELPVEAADFFAGDSLPLRFDRGTFTLAASANIEDWNQLDVRPVLAFRNAAVSPQPGVRSIAGVNPDIFCRAFNEVGTLEIKDLRISGTVANPDVELGQTLTNLVKSSGRAIAKKQLEKGMQKGTEKLGQAVDKELSKLGGRDRLPPEVNKTVESAKKGLTERLKGVPVGEKPKQGTTKK